MGDRKAVNEMCSTESAGRAKGKVLSAFLPKVEISLNATCRNWISNTSCCIFGLKSNFKGILLAGETVGEFFTVQKVEFSGIVNTLKKSGEN